MGIFRHRHRLAFPLLASEFARLKVEADVVLCSSSGWAHGVRAIGHKVVYCHTPARWLYQADRYLAGRQWSARGALGALRAPLTRWDHLAARSARRYLTQCVTVQRR